MAVPFRMGFDVVDEFGIVLSDVFIDSLFGIDCILTFRTAYFNDRLVSQTRSSWLFSAHEGVRRSTKSREREL
jgi:hypothetical protein